jgi:hypothetical protein
LALKSSVSRQGRVQGRGTPTPSLTAPDTDIRPSRRGGGRVMHRRPPLSGSAPCRAAPSHAKRPPATPLSTLSRPAASSTNACLAVAASPTVSILNQSWVLCAVPPNEDPNHGEQQHGQQPRPPKLLRSDCGDRMHQPRYCVKLRCMCASRVEPCLQRVFSIHVEGPVSNSIGNPGPSPSLWRGPSRVRGRGWEGSLPFRLAWSVSRPGRGGGSPSLRAPARPKSSVWRGGDPPPLAPPRSVGRGGTPLP